MEPMLEMAVDYYLRIRPQVGNEKAIQFTLMQYDVDRADLIMAAACKENPVPA